MNVLIYLFLNPVDVMDKQVSVVILRGILSYYKALSMQGSVPYGEVNKLIALEALNEMLCYCNEKDRKKIYSTMLCIIGKSCLLPVPGTGDECMAIGINPRVTEKEEERITEDDDFWKQINED